MHPEGSAASIALLFASLVVLPPLAIGKYRVARRIGSGALRADSLLTGVAAVLASVQPLAVWPLPDAFGFWWADAVAALIVAGLVLREGWGSLALAARD